MMGQKFVQLLANHPWLEVSAVAASDKSVGKSYIATVGGQIQGHILDGLGELQVVEANPRAIADPDIVFSALPTEPPRPIDQDVPTPRPPASPNPSSPTLDPD